MVVTTRARILIAVAAAVTAYVVFGHNDPPTEEPVATSRGVPSRGRPQAETPRSGAGHLLDLLKHRVSDQSGARALFAVHSWYVAPPPPPPPSTSTASVSLAPPVPTAPPLPYQYIGSYKPDGETQVFFLTRGDRVYDVRLGDTLESTYSVDSFNGAQLVLTYKPLNIQQQLIAGGSQ